MKRALFMMCIIMLSSAAAMAESPGKGVFPYKTTVETLDNGLKVIMVPMASGGLVSYYSVVRTGSRDEVEPGHSGFAHFFEHMMFRGTKKYPASMYDRMVTEMGADANAYTTDDYTAYHMSFTKDDLEKVVEIESDRFQNLSYEEAAFQTEAGAVYGEYRKNISSPWMMLNEKMQATAFTAHTYKHTTMGFEADIKAMPTMYEYSKSFFTRYYRPENVVLLVAGDFDPAALMTMIRKYYGPWTRGYVTPVIPVEPPQKGERSATVSYTGKTLPILAISWKGERFDPSNKMMVAATLFGELAFGGNSDLYKSLVLKQQRLQMLEPDFGLNRDPNLWGVYAMVKNPADMAAIQTEIDKTIAMFQTTPVDAKKLSDLKSRMKYGFLMRLDTPERVAGGLARFVALTGGIEAVDQLYAMYDQVTPQDIMDAAKRFFVRNTRTVISLSGRN
ncbi:MAG: insulinase family protein [Ignavibacteria bacterium]|nr:insulinase family protein [Ignavibacteria bacterium]